MTDPEIVLRVVGRYDGVPTEADGRYIVHYDPRLDWDEQQDRAYTLVTSADIMKARGFDSLVAATQFINQVCPNVPLQPSGEPNRPLRVFTIEIATRVA